MTFWQQLLINLALAIPLLPLAVAGIRFRRLSMPQKWLFALLGYTLISNIASEIISEFDTSNIWVFHLYVIVDFTLLTLVFRSLLPKRLLVGAILRQ